MLYTSKDKECSSKCRYRTREKAERVAARQVAEGRAKELFVYGPCIWCRCFHLSSRPNRRSDFDEL